MFGQLQILLADVGHQNEPVELFDVPQVLEEEQAGWSRTADQHVANALCPAGGIGRVTPASAVDPVARMSHASQRLDQRPLLDCHVVRQLDAIDGGDGDVFRQSAGKTGDAVLPVVLTLVRVA